MKILGYFALIISVLAASACSGGGGDSLGSTPTSTAAVWDQSNWDEKNWQ